MWERATGQDKPWMSRLRSQTTLFKTLPFQTALLPFSPRGKPWKAQDQYGFGLQTPQAAMNYQPRGANWLQKRLLLFSFLFFFSKTKITLYVFFRIILVHVFYVRIRRTKFMFMLLTDLKNCFTSHHITAQGPKSHFWGQTYPVKPLLILLTTFACHCSGKMAKVTKICSPGSKTIIAVSSLQQIITSEQKL